MRLELFSVQNFRSIIRAEKLPLQEFTVLLGPNNEGKSNIVQAMVMGMQALAGGPVRPRGLRRRMSRTSGRYEWERDFPRSLQATNPDGRTTMRFDFQLTEEEVGEFFAIVGSRLNAALPITLVFGRTGAPSFRVRKPRHGAALSAKRDEIARFVAERVEVQYVEAIRTGGNVADIVATMLDRELAAAAEQDPAYAEALARVREAQRPIFDSVGASITDKLQGLLPDVADVRIEYPDDASQHLGVGRGLSVVVDDGTPTDLTLKGDGVQSLAALAMTQHYSRETARAREFILAVEEPEAHLHPRAIRGLREALRDTASTQQVIITTHSPLFVNRLDVASNIIVRKNRAQPANSVGELREALGVLVSDSLAAAEVVLVVEGNEDKVAIPPLLADRSPRLRGSLANGFLAVMAMHGGGNLRYFLTQLRDSLASIHVFLDDDEQGRTAAQAADEAGLLDIAGRTFAMCPGAKRESEFEDLVDPSTYAEPFLEHFGVAVDHPWTTQLSRGKWSQRMPTVFQASGTEWNEQIQAKSKEVVAQAVAGRPEHAIKPACEGVVTGLVDALDRKLAQRAQ